jgi:hypothetical protein
MCNVAPYCQRSSFQSLLCRSRPCFLNLLPETHQLLVQLLYLLINPGTPGI